MVDMGLIFVGVTLLVLLLLLLASVHFLQDVLGEEGDHDGQGGQEDQGGQPS